ncbi:MAG: putative toxin-antitoxin system toxin component, PIN family [Betaproteobacteria bacterium]|nr:putative toxin-antitoxin system toxin component, PIN family [Betaproteobacteria bacterium]
MTPPRVVLDTNVVLSALFFSGGATSSVRAGWQSGRFVPLASKATVDELVSAFGYPKFQLTVPEREELLAEYIPWVDVVRIPNPPPDVPRCRDARDVPFLQLAVAGKARALVTGDLDLLALAGDAGLCPVLGVKEFVLEYLAD